jgi:hypothetical protein
VEEQGEPVDEKFQECEILNKKFEHEDVVDPLQRFVDLNSLPTYDDDVNKGFFFPMFNRKKHGKIVVHASSTGRTRNSRKCDLTFRVCLSVRLRDLKYV